MEKGIAGGVREGPAEAASLDAFGAAALLVHEPGAFEENPGGGQVDPIGVGYGSRSEVEFSGQIRPHDGVVRYEIDIVRYQDLPQSGSAITIGDAVVLVDGAPIYEIKRAKVGVFQDIDYADYPWPSERSRGGRMGD